MGRTSQTREQRRQERPEAERHAAEDKRRRIIGAVSAGILVTAMVVAVIVVASTGGDSGATDTAGAFGTHFEGLEDRRVEAGVPTMSDTAAGGDHIHPQLAVYAQGAQVPLPVNIGIDPSRPPELMAGLHTHDQTGVIHVENAAEPTLGQFFEIWGVPFSADRLGPYETEGNERVRMWVDGQPSEEFGDLVLEDGQEVVVAYGTEAELPSGLDG